MEQVLKKMLELEKDKRQLNQRLRVACSLNEGDTLKDKNLCTKSLGVTSNNVGNLKKKKHSLQQTRTTRKTGQQTSRKSSATQEGETSAQCRLDVEHGNVAGCSAKASETRRKSSGNKIDQTDVGAVADVKVTEKKDDKKVCHINLLNHMQFLFFHS